MRRVSEWLRGILGGDTVTESEVAVAGTAVDEMATLPPPSAVDSKPETSPMSEAMTSPGFPGVFAVGWKTDPGKVRGHNEDALLVFTGHQDASQAAPAFGLFMVADGMGGHRNGEAASSLALRASASQLISKIYLPLLSGSDRGANQPALTEVVREAVTQANKVVAQSYPGSGSTLTYGLVLGSRLFVGHVGDSRAYLLRQDQAPQQLTRDHSFVNRLIEMGQLTEEEALSHPQRNVLYRAIGQPDNLEVDVSTWSLRSGDRLLLCSDGLWNMMEESEIWRVIDGGSDLQAICEALVAAANAAGGSDNITIVLAEVHLD